MTWQQGDFNGNGVVDFADVLVVSRGYNSAVAAPRPTRARPACRRRPVLHGRRPHIPRHRQADRERIQHDRPHPPDPRAAQADPPNPPRRPRQVKRPSPLRHTDYHAGV